MSQEESKQAVYAMALKLAAVRRVLAGESVSAVAQEVGIKVHGDDFFRRGQDYSGGLPELRICGAGLGIGADALVRG